MTTKTTERPSLRKQANATLPAQRRDYAIPDGTVDVEARTVELCFSSEAPYERWWGTEILDHGKSAVRLGRLNGGAALLVGHDTRDHVGVVVKAWIDDDRKGRAIVRFGKSPLADQIFQDVKDGIRKLTSVGYRIHKLVLEKEEEGQETYRVTDWEPYELSLVAIPADDTVGVGRSETGAEYLIEIVNSKEIQKMVKTKEELDKEAAEAAAAAAKAKREADERAVREAQTISEGDAALKRERQRITEISAIGKKFNMVELAEKAVENGSTVDVFRSQVIEKLQASGALRTADTPELGLSEAEKKRFSFCRFMLAVMSPDDQGFRKAAGFELECSEAARKKTQREDRSGMTIPYDVLNAPAFADERAASAAVRMLFQRMGGQRDLTVGTTTAGGFTVATDLLASSFIDLLVNQMALASMGVTFLKDLNGNVAIPRQTGKASTFWVAENTNITESQQAFDQVALTPKTVGAFVDYSRRLLLQSSLDVEGFVRMDIARAIALAIDLAGIAGTGAGNQPTGILSTSGIGSEAGGANGLAPTWDNIVNLESLVANANAGIGALGYLSNTKVRGKLKRTQMFSGTNGIPVWATDGTLNGYRTGVSNQVPSNLVKGASGAVCSAIIFGNFADLLIGMWGGLDVTYDPITGAIAGTKRLVALQDLDVNVRHPESFATMQDALTV
jgi:HK97 family phage major capsid protein/HK97 family phage prohead protease